jgi:hypothetical protein
MATRAKKSGRKAGAAKTKKRAGKKRSSSGRSASASRGRKSVAKKAATKRRGGKKAATSKKPQARRAGKQSPIARVKRVAKEVAHQAQVAVTGGVEVLKEMGENIVDRVTG